MRFIPSSLLLFLFLISKTAISQIDRLDQYYPGNPLFKKLKVKVVMDSSFLGSNPVRINEYDREGRITHSYYKGSRHEGYKYVVHSDTLYRFKYSYPESKGFYSAEQFIYNKKNKIIKYVLCRKDYSGAAKVIVSMDEIFYNASDEISSVISYYRGDYPDSLREYMPVKTSLLTLQDVVYYEHLVNKGRLKIVGKHAVGKPAWRVTDTFFYDTGKRLVKKISYSLRGTEGEMVHDDFREIEIFTWSPGKKIEKSYYTYCAGYDPGYKICHRYTESDPEIREYIYDSNGLLKERNFFYQSGKKAPSSTYTYEFYE